MSVKIGQLTIDCKDSKELSEFYAKLLDYEIGEAFGCPLVTSKDKQHAFLFVAEDDYVPPVWPEVDGKQQKQIHFDFVADDYEGEIARAISLGAKRSETQFMPDHFTVLFDPAGHPLCIAKG